MWRGVVVPVAGVLVVAALLSGCGVFRREPKPELPTTQQGIASWYGPGFHGNATSSGEIYDQYQLTAAHQTLPLGSRVRVTNLRNGRSAVVRINDRGPFVGDRVIDLSYAAAQALDLVGPGTAPVRIELADKADAALPAAVYAVQVGAFAMYQNAEQLQTTLRKRFDRVYIATAPDQSPRYYRVRVGPYPRREEATETAQRIGRLGLPAVVMEDGSTPR